MIKMLETLWKIMPNGDRIGITKDGGFAYLPISFKKRSDTYGKKNKEEE